MADPRRHQRRFKNYLLDRSFQLKYAGLLLGVAALLGAALGILLFSTSRSLIRESQSAVSHGQEAVALGKEVTAESRKVREVVEMNIVKDEFYADNPELLAEFQANHKEADDKLADREQALEENAGELSRQAAALEHQQTLMLYTLFIALGLLVLIMGGVGIVVTHRVAGPIFKMTRQINAIAAGHWRVPDPLRKGDELGEFFGAFEAMVRAIRSQREHEIALLTQATDKLEGQLDDAALEPLEELRSELRKVLTETGR